MKLKSQEQIKILKEGGKILAEVLGILADAVKPGITTVLLDELARKLLKERGADAAFLNYSPYFLNKPYPAALCVSINEQIVHAVPSDRILKEGDIISLDLGVRYKGLITDSAITVGVGKISQEAEKLIDITKESLDMAIKEAKAGNNLGDISFAIQNHIEKNNFKVIKKLCGHGVGFEVHEEPDVLNFGKRGADLELVEGMVLAIEPMASVGNSKIKKSKDGFGYETYDGSLAAHFEHTVAITKDGPVVLTVI